MPKIAKFLKVLLIAFTVCFTLVIVALYYALTPPVLVGPPVQAFALEGVHVFKPDGTIQRNASLKVQDRRIDSISDASSTNSPKASILKEFRNHYVYPGLIDLHVHIMPDQPELFSLLFLSHGVTSIRDTGSFDGRIWRRQRRFKTGEEHGPRIFACGEVFDGDPPILPLARIVKTKEEAEAGVREQAEQGASCIKVYANIGFEALKGIRSAAKAASLPVIGHAPAVLPLEEIEDFEAQHFYGLIDKQEGASDLAKWQQTWSNPDLEQVSMIAKKAKGLSFTPTLVEMERFSQLLKPSDSALQAAALLPEYYSRIFWSPVIGHPTLRKMMARSLPKNDSNSDAAMRGVLRVVAKLRELKVPLYLGTDTPNPYVIPGRSLWDEMRLFEQAGFSRKEILQLATKGAGQRLGRDDLGVMRSGAVADFIILEKDPLDGLDALASVKAVVIDGRLIHKRALADAHEQHRRHEENPLTYFIMNNLARGLIAYLNWNDAE